MSGITEDVELIKTTHSSNPFTTKPTLFPLVINDLDVFNRLTNNGRRVAKYVGKNLNQLEVTTVLEVEKITVLEFGVYHETNATRIRRGIKDLLANEVVANTLSKNIYWVNKNIIWK